jgi:hypothetical protein
MSILNSRQENLEALAFVAQEDPPNTLALGDIDVRN